MAGPVVAVTAITRKLDVNLRNRQPQATVHRRLGELVTAAGVVPVFVSPDADPEGLAGRIDAVIVNGGEDLDPACYSARPDRNLRDTDSERDRFELDLVRRFRDRRSPVLGVCRGMHVVNVALGGTLHQHLPDLTDLEHERRQDFDRPAHPVAIEPGSIVADALEREGPFEIDVNSIHHQAVDRLGEGLEAIAAAPDGTVEAISTPDRRILGIQWHPEFLTPEHDPIFLPILREFLG